MYCYYSSIILVTLNVCSFNLHIYLWIIPYVIVWILSKRVIGLTHHFGLFNILLSILWCHSARVFLSSYALLQASKGHTYFSLPCVRTSPCISPDLLQGHTLASNKYILLTSTHYRSKGINLLPTSGTPTPNGLRLSWDFLSRRSLDILVGPTPSTNSYILASLDQ